MTPVRPPKKTESIEIRVSHETKGSFMAACKRRGESASAVIRGFIHGYVADANRAPHPNRIKEFSVTTLIKNNYAKAAAASALAGASIILATPSSAADPRLLAVFGWYDSNNDAVLSPAEFMKPEIETQVSAGATELTGVEIIVTTRSVPSPDEPRDAVFGRLDKDQDGVVSQKEFVTAVFVKTVLHAGLFDADQDGDGAVSAVELAAHFAANAERAGSQNAAGEAALFAQGLIDAHDANKDGVLAPGELKG